MQSTVVAAATISKLIAADIGNAMNLGGDDAPMSAFADALDDELSLMIDEIADRLGVDDILVSNAVFRLSCILFDPPKVPKPRA